MKILLLLRCKEREVQGREVLMRMRQEEEGFKGLEKEELGGGNCLRRLGIGGSEFFVMVTGISLREEWRGIQEHFWGSWNCLVLWSLLPFPEPPRFFIKSITIVLSSLSIMILFQTNRKS